ncbi:MAG: hypothetical protein ACI9WU_002138, partial [Myxococcota bacterium]
GLQPQRYGGDAAVFVNVDARLFLTRFRLLVPIDLGLHTFIDAGRVFLEGEGSRRWHPSGGGGFWLAPLARVNTFTFSVAASRETVRFYATAGVHY